MKLIILSFASLFLITSCSTPQVKSKTVFAREARRGGTSTGQEIKVNTKASQAWFKLKSYQGSKKQKDRLAILALAGEYKTNFDFLYRS